MRMHDGSPAASTDLEARPLAWLLDRGWCTRSPARRPTSTTWRGDGAAARQRTW